MYSKYGENMRILGTATAGVVAGTIWALLLIGRSFWGTAGGPGLWTSDVYGSLNSQLLTDPYSFSHFNYGLISFLLLTIGAAGRLSIGARFLAAMVMHAVWEVIENTPFVIERFREETMAQGYYGDSILNSTGDILAAAVGFAIAVMLSARFSNRWVLVLFLVSELLLGLWIRDNMILITVMLIYPIAEILEWQTR